MQLWKSAAIIVGLLGAAGAAQAQDPAAPQWQEIAASDAKTYLADTANALSQGDGVAMQVAIVPRTGAASDYSHTVDQYTIRCAANQFQVASGVIYGADGSEEDRWSDDAAPWDPVRPGSLAEGVKEIVCDGGSSTGVPYATIRAFIDGGRQ